MEDWPQANGQQMEGWPQQVPTPQAWHGQLGNMMSGQAQPSIELNQYGDLNPDPQAGMDFGMAGEGGMYPHSFNDWGKHLGDVFPGGIGAPQADPMYQMWGDAAPFAQVLKPINEVWQAPGNLGEHLGGKAGRFLITGNPFDLFG